MGLHVNVFRNRGVGCTNGGISDSAHSLCLVNVQGPFEPTTDAPAALLESHFKSILRIVPAIKKNGEWIADPRWAMFGGNFAATSDSRFSDACRKLIGHDFYGAVAIHDRYETAEESELLSR